MTRKNKFFNASIFTSLWLATGTAAYANCGDYSPNAADLSDEATATNCLLGARADSIIGAQIDLQDRRNTGVSGIEVTQGIDGTNAEGFSGPLWVSLSGRWSTYENADLDLGLATIGSDVVVTERALAGVMLQNDFAFQDGPLGASFDATGYMIGVYGMAFTDTLTFDARALAGQSKNDVTGGGNQADDVTSNRWLAALQVSGFTTLGEGRYFVPHFAISWFEDTMEAYMLGLNSVAEQTVSYGQSNIGGTLRIPTTFGGNDGTYFAGLSGIYGFGDAAGDQVPDDLRAKIDVGLDMYRADAWSVSGRVSADGIGLDDYEAYSVDLGITLWF